MLYRIYDMNDTARQMDIDTYSAAAAIDIFLVRSHEDYSEAVSVWKFVTNKSRYFIVMNPKNLH